MDPPRIELGHAAYKAALPPGGPNGGPVAFMLPALFVWARVDLGGGRTKIK